MYKDWINNEYQKWIEALESCTVDNFKENAMVQSMLGECNADDFLPLMPEDLPWEKLYDLDKIGRVNHKLSGAHLRFVYYALKILEQKPTNIIEIGAGVGQLYCTLRVLGFKGEYYIYDLPEVKKFQLSYRKEVQNKLGIDLSLDVTRSDHNDNFCVSCYALGEFDDETKERYIEEVVKKCPHGLIVWNPHSGASEEFQLNFKIEDEYPLTSKGNKLITW